MKEKQKFFVKTSDKQQVRETYLFTAVAGMKNCVNVSEVKTLNTCTRSFSLKPISQNTTFIGLNFKITTECQ